MADTQPTDRQTITNYLRNIIKDEQINITQVDDPGNSEAIIINAVIQLLTNKANLNEYGDSAAKTIMDAARQISKQLIELVNKTLTEVDAKVNSVDINEFIMARLHFLVDEYVSSMIKTYKYAFKDFMGEVLFRYDGFAADLIAEACKAAATNFEADKLSVPEIPEVKPLETLSAILPTRIRSIDTARAKLRERLDRSSELINSLQKTVTNLQQTGEQIDAADDETTKLDQATVGPATPTTPTTPAAIPDLTAERSGGNPTKDQNQIIKALRRTSVGTGIPLWLDKIVPRLRVLKRTVDKTLKLTTKLNKQTTAQYNSRSIIDIVAPVPGLTTGTGSSSGGSFKKAGSIVGWLLAFAGIFAVMALISDNWKIALGRTVLVLPIVAKLVARVKLLLRKTFLNSTFVAGFRRSMLIRTKMILRNSKTWQAFKKTKIAGRLFPNLTGKLLGKPAVAAKAASGLGAKLLGVVGFGITAYGELTEDPTEWAARATGISVEEYRKQVDAGKRSTTGARAFNVVTGGERGFLNAIFNGLKWSSIGLFFPPIGPPLMFALGVLTNLIGRENFLKLYNALKPIVVGVGKFLKKLMFMPLNITTSVFKKVASWVKGLWTKYKTRKILVTTVDKIIAYMTLITDKFDGVHKHLTTMLIQLGLAREKFAVILADSGDKLYTALLEKTKVEYRTLIEEPIRKHHAKISEKTNILWTNTQAIMATLKEAEKTKRAQSEQNATSLTQAVSRLDTIKNTVGKLANYIGSKSYELNVTQQVTNITANAPEQQHTEPATAFAQMQALYT